MLSTIALAATLSVLATVQAVPFLHKRDSGYIISPNTTLGENQVCLATSQSSKPADGIFLSYQPCNTIQITHKDIGGYGLWQIAPGNNPNGIQLSGTNFCLDAGSNPGSQANVPAKIWTCYAGLTQQTFYYTDDLHIAVTGGDYCLTENRYGCQFEACGTKGTIEAFNLLNADLLPATSMAPSPTSTVAVTSTAVASVQSWQCSGPDVNQLWSIAN